MCIIFFACATVCHRRKESYYVCVWCTDCKILFLFLLSFFCSAIFYIYVCTLSICLFASSHLKIFSIFFFLCFSFFFSSVYQIAEMRVAVARENSNEFKRSLSWNPGPMDTIVWHLVYFLALRLTSSNWWILVLVECNRSFIFVHKTLKDYDCEF